MEDNDPQQRLYRTVWAAELEARLARAADPDSRQTREATAYLTALVGALTEQALEGYRAYRLQQLDDGQV